MVHCKRAIDFSPYLRNLVAGFSLEKAEELISEQAKEIKFVGPVGPEALRAYAVQFLMALAKDNDNKLLCENVSEKASKYKYAKKSLGSKKGIFDMFNYLHMELKIVEKAAKPGTNIFEDVIEGTSLVQQGRPGQRGGQKSTGDIQLHLHDHEAFVHAKTRMMAVYPFRNSDAGTQQQGEDAASDDDTGMGAVAASAVAGVGAPGAAAAAGSDAGGRPLKRLRAQVVGG